MALKPYRVHNMHAYQCTYFYEFQRTGRQVHRFSVWKAVYCYHSKQQSRPTTWYKINTYHENVDSRSTGSIRYTALLHCLQNKIWFQRLPNPCTEQQYCNPTKLNWLICMLRTDTPSRGEKEGVDIDMTTTLLQTIVMLRARISFAEYIINERKTKNNT